MQRRMPQLSPPGKRWLAVCSGRFRHPPPPLRSGQENRLAVTAVAVAAARPPAPFPLSTQKVEHRMGACQPHRPLLRAGAIGGPPRRKRGGRCARHGPHPPNSCAAGGGTRVSDRRSVLRTARRASGGRLCRGRAAHAGDAGFFGLHAESITWEDKVGERCAWTARAIRVADGERVEWGGRGGNLRVGARVEQLRQGTSR